MIWRIDLISRHWSWVSPQQFSDNWYYVHPSLLFRVRYIINTYIHCIYGPPHYAVGIFIQMEFISFQNCSWSFFHSRFQTLIFILWKLFVYPRHCDLFFFIHWFSSVESYLITPCIVSSAFYTLIFILWKLFDNPKHCVWWAFYTLIFILWKLFDNP